MKRVGMLWLGLLGCADTGQERLRVALSAQGASENELAVGDARFTLSRADVAFGPLYMCATESADPEHCEVALLELRETVLIDGLAPDSDVLARLSGTTGEVRSALYDFGISWYLTRERPAPAGTAPEGHSAVLEGDVTLDGATLHFVAPIDVTPRARGDLAMNAQRTRHELVSAGQALTVRVDPLRWLMRVDVAALFALDGDADGQVVLAPGDQAYEAIVQGMQSAAPPVFVWSDTEAP